MKWLNLFMVLWFGMVLFGAARTAHSHPVPWLQHSQGYDCQAVIGGNLKVHYCTDRKSTTIDVRTLKALQEFMTTQYKLAKPRVTTVYIEHNLLSARFRGAYFPLGGFIVMTDNTDDTLETVVLAHELLHFIWHWQGTPFNAHHQRIYCNDELEPVVSWLKHRTGDHRNRLWISPAVKERICGS